MLIEVGEYIRTENGIIAKLDYIGDNFDYFFDRTIYRKYSEYIDFLQEYELDKYIVKHSKDIIDLIKSGDYVNGLLVNCIINVNGEKIIRCVFPYRENSTEYKDLEEKGSDYCKLLHLRANDIKTIVTKEQMEDIQYVVK